MTDNVVKFGKKEWRGDKPSTEDALKLELVEMAQRIDDITPESYWIRSIAGELRNYAQNIAPGKPS